MNPIKKILIFEYITGGGLAGKQLPVALIAEAELMLQALVTDLVSLPGLEITVLRDVRLQALNLETSVGSRKSTQALGAPGKSEKALITNKVTTSFSDSPCTPQTYASFSRPTEVSRLNTTVKNVFIRNAEDQNLFWHEALTKTDAVWVIAPETDGVLEMLSREVEATDVHSLNSTVEAIALTASKLQTAKWLMEHDIPVVENQTSELLPTRWVVKPDDGVGCEDIHLFPDQQIATAWQKTNTDGRKWILQPWLEGEHLSLSLLCKQGEVLILSVNRQHLVMQEEGLKLTACEVNALENIPEFHQLARQITKTIPGLWGYVGIDLLLTSDGPVVVEINPRLTTSYAGLNRALGLNPAAMILSLINQPIGKIKFDPTKVSVHLELPDVV